MHELLSHYEIIVDLNNFFEVCPENFSVIVVYQGSLQICKPYDALVLLEDLALDLSPQNCHDIKLVCYFLLDLKEKFFLLTSWPG